jgi:hypothetical protein
VESTIKDNLDATSMSSILAGAWQQADPQYTFYSSERNVQRLALATLYYATNGNLWINNTGWLSYDISECEWFSHSSLDQICDSNGSYLHLHLDNINLVGTIPNETSLLSNLELLNLSGNALTSTIPSPLEKLTNLNYFILAYNSLNGSIPVGVLTRLSNLSQLGLNNNL